MLHFGNCTGVPRDSSEVVTDTRTKLVGLKRGWGRREGREAKEWKRGGKGGRRRRGKFEGGWEYRAEGVGCQQ